jgi:hypothetical protein
VRWVASAVAGLVVVLALAACGGTSLTSTPVAAAADKTLKQQTGHIAITGTETVEGQTVSMSGDGDFEVNPNLGSFVMDVSNGKQDSMITEILDGTVIYMKSPVFAATLPAGKAWISVDYAKVAKKFGVNLQQLGNTNPTGELQALMKAGHVTAIGPETIDGVVTTHYRAVIDVSKLPQKLVQSTNVKYSPVDVWSGKDDLVRRIGIKLTVNVSGQPGAMNMKMRVSKYGEPVNIQVPSSDKAVDISKLGG